MVHGWKWVLKCYTFKFCQIASVSCKYSQLAFAPSWLHHLVVLGASRLFEMYYRRGEYKRPHLEANDTTPLIQLWRPHGVLSSLSSETRLCLPNLGLHPKKFSLWMTPPRTSSLSGAFFFSPWGWLIPQAMNWRCKPTLWIPEQLCKVLQLFRSFCKFVYCGV